MQHRQRRDRAAEALGRAMRQQAEDLTRMADNLLDEVPDATVVATQTARTMACLVDYAAAYAVAAELDEAAARRFGPDANLSICLDGDRRSVTFNEDSSS